MFSSSLIPIRLHKQGIQLTKMTSSIVRHLSSGQYWRTAFKMSEKSVGPVNVGSTSSITKVNQFCNPFFNAARFYSRFSYSTSSSSVSIFPSVTGKFISSTPRLFTSQPQLANVTSSQHYRLLHTEVDAELSRFLEKEIGLGQNTKKYPAKLPVIDGFDIVTDNAKITLTKTLGNETITINLNINHSVDADEAEIVNESQDDDVTQMVSRPPFTVDINQGGTETFALQCSFPTDIDDDLAGKDDAMGKQNNRCYHITNLYDLLMDMLDERGINDEFINQLMDFCTVYEHKRYLSFLNGIKRFVDKK
ncbi:conserved regulator of innate immunity protein 3 [Octopus bimaculoides]|uniref:conserved regulator of innate immunity protein 3 n=1 Tax=Octopus bimaculoides TaxID=37653 RepID=UPI00071D6434|nr:conserved regulator of innate immunity protein 3 [Octopus bimaculoides]|eukprot:XP_014782645.1 PREDICTED: conserved regulator of innate immunity protein 3-like [Octopus bimaculoides]